MNAIRGSVGAKAFTTTKPHGTRSRFLAVVARCQSSDVMGQVSRRSLMQGTAAIAASIALTRPQPAQAEGRVLCDEDCSKALEGKERVTLPSGLQYHDIVEGKGSTPPVGFQVVVHYVAMTPNYRVFENSLEKRPYDIRVGAGQVVPGLDEGLSSMKPGGIRRLYIPGNLSFPKGLKAAAGRPSVPPNSPVIFDVQLLYIPGLEDDEE